MRGSGIEGAVSPPGWYPRALGGNSTRAVPLCACAVTVCQDESQGPVAPEEFVGSRYSVGDEAVALIAELPGCGCLGPKRLRCQRGG